MTSLYKINSRGAAEQIAESQVDASEGEIEELRWRFLMHNPPSALHSFSLFIRRALSLLSVLVAATAVVDAGQLLYVYSSTNSSDSTQALGYKSLFDSLGHTTTLIKANQVVSTNLSLFDVIVISSGTGSSAGWGGDSASIAALKNSGKPFLSMGAGGLVLMDYFGNWAGWGRSAGIGGTTVFVSARANTLLTSPNNISVPADSILTIYGGSFGGQALSVGGTVPGTVLLLGYVPTNRNYAPIALEKGKFFYWGFYGPAIALTPVGRTLLANVLSLLVKTATAVETDTFHHAVPTNVILDQNYPNPFNPSTIISYSLPKTASVSLRIFNALGQEVALLVNEHKETGNYQATWSASSVPSGIYFYRLQAGEFIQTKKMILLR